ncbi:hypothetical protein OIU78_004022 [Salix suchowensis]|nr:hypothetical protein OIU78_004022 [Salix suchowensis]
MAMAILFTGKSSANASLILCIIAVSLVSMALGRHGLAGRKDPDEKVFNVLRYGAHPGSEDNALSFIRAWKAACNYRGKARLLFPKGTFLTGATIFQGPCLGPAPIKVQIAGTLRAVPDPSMYEEDFWISFENINGLLVTGTGTVDGQGNAVWKYNVGDGGAIIGSLGKYQDEEDVRGITVKNCTLNNTDNGIRIKTFGGSPPSQASGILFQDIVMNRVKNPIIIDQFYGNKESPSRVKLRDVRYHNIRGTSTSVVGVNIKCSHTVPCERVSLSNISLKYVGEKKSNHEISSVCTNAKLNYAGFQLPSPCR